jgi:hypothetical protein
VTGLAPSGIAMLEFGSSGSVLAIMCRISFAVGTCGGGWTRPGCPRLLAGLVAVGLVARHGQAAPVWSTDCGKLVSWTGNHAVLLLAPVSSHRVLD